MTTTKTEANVGEFDVLFTSLDETMEALDRRQIGTADQLRNTTRLAHEIEELRVIAEQLNADNAAVQLLTIGGH
jgi:cell shape-determining protein MreC